MQAFKRSFYKSKNLNIVHYNARSLISNMAKPVESLRKFTLTFDSIAKTET